MQLLDLGFLVGIVEVKVIGQGEDVGHQEMHEGEEF